MLKKPATMHVSCNRHSGFTLIELMVVIAIIAVGATLAAPDFSRMTANNKIRAEAESILNGLNFARAEALRRNSAVAFSLLAGNSGWTVNQLSPSAMLQSHSINSAFDATLTASTPNTSVTFLSTGLLQAGGQLSQVTVSSAVQATKTRRINIFGGGLIRMCEPDVIAANDPRRC